MLSAAEMVPEVGYAPGEANHDGLSDEAHRLMQRQLIGRMLGDPDTVGAVLDSGLKPRHFDQPREKRALRAMSGLYTAGKPVSFDGVLTWLQERQDAQPGFDTWMTSVVADQLVAEPVGVAKLLVRHAQWLLLEKAAKLLQQASRERRWTPEEVRQDLIDKLDLLLVQQHEGQHISEFVKPLIELWEGRRPPTAVLTTGLESLDEVVKFRHGGMTCISAASSMGKSTFATTLIDCLSVQQRLPGALFTFEDGGEEYTQRLVAGRSGIATAKLDGEVSGELWPDLGRAAGAVETAPVEVREDPGWTAARIRTECQRLRARGGLRYVVIDQLDKLQHPQADRHDLRLSATTSQLKLMARELDIHVFLLHQLTKEVGKRKNPRPTMADLRDGPIENDCDVVLLLFRVEYYLRLRTPAAKRGLLEVIVGKQRKGPTTTVEMHFDGAHSRVREREHSDDQADEEDDEPSGPQQAAFFDGDDR